MKLAKDSDIFANNFVVAYLFHYISFLKLFKKGTHAIQVFASAVVDQHISSRVSPTYSKTGISGILAIFALKSSIIIANLAVSLVLAVVMSFQSPVGAYAIPVNCTFC